MLSQAWAQNTSKLTRCLQSRIQHNRDTATSCCAPCAPSCNQQIKELYCCSVSRWHSTTRLGMSGHGNRFLELELELLGNVITRCRAMNGRVTWVTLPLSRLYTPGPALTRQYCTWFYSGDSVNTLSFSQFLPAFNAQCSMLLKCSMLNAIYICPVLAW